MREEGSKVSKLDGVESWCWGAKERARGSLSWGGARCFLRVLVLKVSACHHQADAQEAAGTGCRCEARMSTRRKSKKTGASTRPQKRLASRPGADRETSESPHKMRTIE